MEDTNRVYRIRTSVGDDAPSVIHVPLNQSYDMFEILSLKLDQTNTYKSYESDYGVIVGRVTANGGFGIPNAKVSVFIEVSDEETLKNRFLYNYSSTSDTNDDGVRYNVLTDFTDDVCHQDVGTFPNKRLLLDNQDIIDVFDKYWKYTTTTNHAGDYMLFGVPTGSQQLHVDVDLSDCGILSQRPRDMIAKGYNINMFESPNKFKHSTNLNSLVQIVSQDRGVYVYPYWGDISEGDEKFSITRCDINLEYKFESYAVFIGSIITDKGSNAIGKNCTATQNNGKMSDLIAGEGKIEMIRKTLDNKVEEFPIMGNRLIDGDGVWCYQIPMNLDYVTTDEFGNLVPTDNPEKGIATRTKVRFRITLDENPNDATARKRASYLVPNNPRMGEGNFDETQEADYEFGSLTRDESYCEMFWNKVYTVKNYIPKLQKNDKEKNKKHTGIKLVNHFGDNNPMPYNSLTIDLGFVYRLICIITRVIINLFEFINEIISLIGAILCLLIKIIELPGDIIYQALASLYVTKPVGKLFRKLWRKASKLLTTPIWAIMPNCIALSSDFCDDGVNKIAYYPGCGYFLFSLFKLKKLDLDCVWEDTVDNHEKNQLQICANEKKTKKECEMALTTPSNETAMLYNCIENQLAQQNEAISFNFNNDWINGVLYAPLWYRKIKPKRSYFFGLRKIKAKDDWCSSQRPYNALRILQQCTTHRDIDRKVGDNGEYINFDGDKTEFRRVIDYRCDGSCHKKNRQLKGMHGVIHSKETMLGQTIYYYKAVEYNTSLPSNPLYHGSKMGDIKLLFATDIVLLGSLNDCDINGVPQFFKTLESTTYNLPNDILFTDYDFILTVNEKGESERMKYTSVDLVKTSEMAGCDWGNPNEFDKNDGGLFYSIGCTSRSIKLDTKSCINLARICEYGVSLDETKEVADLKQMYDQLPDPEQAEIDARYSQKLITDGFISWDELYNLDERSMFATMNANGLKTVLNKQNGIREYDFRYLYPENFDGSLKEIMYNRTKNYNNKINYKNNWKLEEASRDYYIFRMGNKPYYYDMDKGEDGYAFPRYENSFYFYFGLKSGKTAIEKFNSKYFAECSNPDTTESQINIKTKSNSWCVRKDITDEEKESGYSNANDGYAAFDFSSFSTPYDLLINGVSNGNYSIEIKEITDEKIQFNNNIENLSFTESLSGYAQMKGIFANDIWTYSVNGDVIPMMNNGSYQCSITDNDGNITEFAFNIKGAYLSFGIEVQDFEEPNNVLENKFRTWNEVAEYRGTDGNIDVTTDPKNVQRLDIGGVITISDIFMDGERMNRYKIEIRATEGTQLDLDGVYSGVYMIYKNGVVTFSVGEQTCLNKDIDNHNYAFGLPKGGCEYTITITQLCDDDIDSNNFVSKDFFVSEPMPYKMFINEIDYELLKKFKEYTGWKTSRNSKIADPRVEIDDSPDVWNVNKNPWFNIENIYYNQNLLNIDSNSQDAHINNDIESFSVELNEEEVKFVIKAVTNDGNEYIIFDDEHVSGIDTLLEEFTKNKCGQKGVSVYYNWVDDYIVSGYDHINWDAIKSEISNLDDRLEAYNAITDFIENVNEVLFRRRELISMMSDTFFMSCKDKEKSFYISSQTNKTPYTQTIVYHPEKAVEYEDYNVLDGDNLISENVSEVSDIRIPTISYKSSTDFGDGTVDSDLPCIAQVENIKKKPYYVGIMNHAGISIPTDEYGSSFAFVEEGDDKIKYIKDNTELKYLFDFPLIDKILNFDFVAWSAFVNIPQFGYNNGAPRKGIVNMNGLLAGAICNGNVINNRFDVQTLNDFELVLSNNLTNKTETYIEKRIINGFNYSEIGKWLLTFLKKSVYSSLTEDLISLIETLFSITFDGEDKQSEIYSFLNSVRINNEKIIYIIDDIERNIRIPDILPFILNFTEYITNSDAPGELQYAFVLPIDTVIELQDESGCGVSEVINGTLMVKLNNNSVNDCRDLGKKVVEVAAEDNMFYSIFRCDENGDAYPLNHAVKNGIWQITETVNGIYDPTSNTQNLFSFQMKSKYLRGENNLIDTEFESQTLVSGDDEEERYDTTYGYGTTGVFKRSSFFNQLNHFEYPFFIVAETDNNVRAISPVYDYSKVCALVRFGKIERKDFVEIEGGEIEIQTKEEYRFAVAVKKGGGRDYKGQFYLENYDYTLSATCEAIADNIIEVAQDTLSAPGEFLFTPITETSYNSLKSKMNLLSKLAFANNTKVTAIDYTGLKHICNVSRYDIEEVYWYSIRWYANLPSGYSGGIRYKNTYHENLERIYKENTEVDLMECKITNGDLIFLGWSENKPNAQAIITPITTATESKIYYANWEIPSSE